MKRWKEFLWMLFPFLGLIGLELLYIGLSVSADVFTVIYKMLNNGFFIIAFIGVVTVDLFMSLGLTFVYTSFVRKKMEVWGRRRYYLYLYLMALIVPVAFNVVILRIFDVVLGLLYALQIGIFVVFVHWAVDWVREKRNSPKDKSEDLGG